MADLVVELYGTKIGVLAGPSWRTFDFVTDPDAIAEFGIDSQILSMVIPLTVVPVRSRKDRRQNFFGSCFQKDGCSHGSRSRPLSSSTVLSTAVGNLDMHTKNISLLHHPDGSMTLSPACDVVPQAHQSNDGEIALAIDGEYRHTAITMDHLLAEGRR